MPYDMIILFVVPLNEHTLQIIYFISPPPQKNFITDSSPFRILKKTGKWLHEYKTENTQDESRTVPS